MWIFPLLLICKYVYDSHTSLPPPPPKKKKKEMLGCRHKHSFLVKHIRNLMKPRSRPYPMRKRVIWTNIAFDTHILWVTLHFSFPLTWSFWKRAWGWVIGFAFVFGSGITRLRLKWWRLKLKKKNILAINNLLLWVTELLTCERRRA